ncbi:hypothetical protein EBL_c00260 [Shimwellia blattae DSM 4481 = NBRC 105725]|uniref:Uncharacterized protein n=1 Tax=Shimwellia blattae (strain ATCC 29907 / DSM 4481 / JCM 1650 / NBRC 105725 / CDC 9005-74) TaxID=630626 RepID=I2B3Q9_SHIBC|nr:hypothetical protein EBL_c00260 [Shimwellia blattae DSM 4481 = NBRC 105725]
MVKKQAGHKVKVRRGQKYPANIYLRKFSNANNNQSNFTVSRAINRFIAG